MTTEELARLVRACGVMLAVVDSSQTPVRITLVCEHGGPVVVTTEQARYLVKHYLLPVHVIRAIAPHLHVA